MTGPSPQQIVIVGASAAGVSAAMALRDQGYAGRLTLVDAQPHLPYERPPLSKKVLTLPDEEPSWLYPAQEYSHKAIDLRLGLRAQRLQEGAVHLDSGEALPFDRLLIATGVTARQWPGQMQMQGTHVLRSWDDALRLRHHLRQAQRVVVIGAGVLGCELAASARSLGLHVTLIDPQPVPMQRQLGPVLGGLLADLHRAQGVDLLCATGVQRLLAQDGRFAGVQTGDGRTLAADLLVVAIGAAPSTDWLQDSGLDLREGVVCDAYCRAADGIYAAGDVARWTCVHSGKLRRVEHRMHAAEQGAHAAANMLGAQQVFDPTPFFWTDQYQVKIQGYGFVEEGDEPVVAAGELQSGRFVMAFVGQDRINALVGWNAARDLRLLRNRIGLPRAQLAAPQGA